MWFLALADAERARSIAASGTHVRCRLQGAEGDFPYVDLDGAPLLVLPRPLVDRVCSDVMTCIRLGRSCDVGWVVLAGSFTEVPCDALPATVRDDVRRASRGLADAPHGLVHLDVETVVLTDPGQHAPSTAVPLDDYLAARPHEVLARGWTVLHHANAGHVDDVRAAAAGLREKPLAAIAAADLTDVDPEGVDLQVVDDEGGWAYRVLFRAPAHTLLELNEEVGHLVQLYGGKHQEA